MSKLDETKAPNYLSRKVAKSERVLRIVKTTTAEQRKKRRGDKKKVIKVLSIMLLLLSLVLVYLLTQGDAGKEEVTGDFRDYRVENGDHVIDILNIDGNISTVILSTEKLDVNLLKKLTVSDTLTVSYKYIDELGNVSGELESYTIN